MRMWTRAAALAALLLGALAQMTGACVYAGSRAFEAGASEAASQAGETAQQNEFRWRKALGTGRVVEIKGVNGNVRAEPSTGNEVEVVAVKSARKSDPAGVQIVALEHADGVTICAVYPSPDASRQNTCEPGDSWRSHTRNNDVVVNFTVRVPAGVRFSGRTVNGAVEARSLGADVKAYTVNGGVEVSTTGMAEAGTVNGSLHISMGRADWTGKLDFQTVNGGITLELPASASAEVNGETVNGDIQTDFPLTVQGRFSRNRLTGTIGSGGRELALKTVNGPIRIRRAS